MVLKRQALVQHEAPPEGRYVRIEHPYEPLSVVDISVWDLSGERVIAQEAAMSSSFCTEEGCAFPASRMTDGSIATFCCTQGLDESRRLSWLRVDLGRPVTIGRIDILGRLDDGESSDFKQQHGLTDATVSVTRDRMGLAGVWESSPIPAGPKLLSYTWRDTEADRGTDAAHSEHTDGGGAQGARRARVLTAASELYSKALAGEGEADLTGLEYPEGDFVTLETVLATLFPSDSTPLPSDWATLPGEGVLMPFSTTGERATRFRVRKRFTSKAQPFWVQLQSAGEGQSLDVVMKAGDDLRQDQVCVCV
jgi:hypothetical protein